MPTAIAKMTNYHTLSQLTFLLSDHPRAWASSGLLIMTP